MKLLSDDKFVRNRTLVILVTAGVFAASWLYAPYVGRGPVICFSHGLLGLPCPACGLTRAFCELAHGRFAAAAEHNAIAFPLFALFLVALPTAGVELALGRRLAFYRFMYSTRLAWILGGALILYHVGRTAVWYLDGRLYADYVTTSWTFSLWQRLFS
jgi:hypothetical protein